MNGREGQIREQSGRVRRRLISEAVADNVATIRGLPPRRTMPANRLAKIWLRRASLLLVPLTLVASTWIATSQPSSVAASAPIHARRSSPPLVADPPSEPLQVTSIAPQRVAAAAFPLAVQRVVLDAGHGGIDPGASALGLTEKDVTLDIGRRLGSLLEANGFEVVRTRGEDRTLPLRERSRLANQSRSDIFVSIHVNSLASHTDSHGVETYYLGATSDPSLTRLASAENSVSGYSMADLRKLLDGVYADVRRDESLQLATVVQQRLFTRMRAAHPGVENWGVKRAPFVVLVATDMPAILTEVGCISNLKEAVMLGKPEYRQKIAEALYHGIHAYASANDAPLKKGS